MSATTDTAPVSPAFLRPLGWVGRTVLTVMSYVGGTFLLSVGAVGWLLRKEKDHHVHGLPSFTRTTVRQISWMLALGFPLVGLVHIAMGSFLALQAYYGSTFIDGTGAVVGVGLLRNLGGMMAGIILAAILAARMIPELRRLSGTLAGGEPHGPFPVAVRLAAPRIAAAMVACPLLSMWGVAVGTLVGWQASLSMMGLPTETFFMMMTKMMWFRDIIGLVFKGLLFGMLPATICCHEALRSGFREEECSSDRAALHADAGAPLATPVFRATCLGIISILIVNMTWFVLVYHAVPYYGPTLLKPPSPS
jgi:phospholipid/cholesterol/gamma-HCH transport system permease protein